MVKVFLAKALILLLPPTDMQARDASVFLRHLECHVCTGGDADHQGSLDQ